MELTKEKIQEKINKHRETLRQIETRRKSLLTDRDRIFNALAQANNEYSVTLGAINGLQELLKEDKPSDENTGDN